MRSREQAEDEGIASFTSSTVVCRAVMSVASTLCTGTVVVKSTGDAASLRSCEQAKDEGVASFASSTVVCPTVMSVASTLCTGTVVVKSTESVESPNLGVLADSSVIRFTGFIAVTGSSVGRSTAAVAIASAGKSVANEKFVLPRGRRMGTSHCSTHKFPT